MAESVLMIFILLNPLRDLSSRFLSLAFYINFIGFPRSIFLIDSLITLIFIAGLRLSKRVYLEVFLSKKKTRLGKRTIIIGAGNTGEMIIRDIIRQDFSNFYPIGFLDDEVKKIGMYIHGVKVLGTIDRLKTIIPTYNVEAVIIAIPSLNYKSLRDIYTAAKSAGVEQIKIVPRIYNFHKPEINLKNLEEISIEDLVGRQIVTVNYEEIKGFLNDKIVLVTGAGGSIGSEITLQLCAFYPQKVILFDIDETALHNMEHTLNRFFPYLKERLHFVVGDIKDSFRIEEVFKKFKPQIVFHAAAYKHVPMMEYNPKEAVKVNIFGTYYLVKASRDYGVEKFILISTDKAVRPTSIMGATKRISEYICTAFNNDKIPTEGMSNTEFISVRFGNVLGSRGSVLPLFMEQLKHGGPLTITHKDIKRYFMTTPEAVALVLQAAVIGKGCDVLVLDMGKPVKIIELAEELIRIHGLEPYKDIDIEFIGLRPGEKLFEELLTDEEGTVATKHEKIFIAKSSDKYTIKDIESMLEEFKDALFDYSESSHQKIRSLLRKYVKHFEGY